jgi:hypothetical protein
MIGVGAGDSAQGLAEFIRATAKYDVYWLTTHCMDGDPSRAQAMLKYDLPQELHPLIDRIKPTVWNERKTEAIDFTKEFVWYRDKYN